MVKVAIIIAIAVQRKIGEIHPGLYKFKEYNGDLPTAMYIVV
jgi:hypothetical protein